MVVELDIIVPQEQQVLLIKVLLEVTVHQVQVVRFLKETVEVVVELELSELLEVHHQLGQEDLELQYL